MGCLVGSKDNSLPMYVCINQLLYLVVTYFRYLWTYFLHKGVTKVKPDINSVNVHPQLSHNGHPVDGVLVGVGSLRPTCIWPTCI
jgi:hypothetical protein